VKLPKLSLAFPVGLLAFGGWVRAVRSPGIPLGFGSRMNPTPLVSSQTSLFSSLANMEAVLASKKNS
jgi:hypothetical protein